MKSLFRWSDVAPGAVIGLVVSIVAMADSGFHWGYFAAALWAVVAGVEYAMRHVTERERDDWKKIAMSAHKAGALLILAARGQRLVVTQPADGLTLEESQAAVDAICDVVRAVEDVEARS